MTINSTVVLILNNPREKAWGKLLDLSPAGVTVRGIDLNYFEEWLQQWGSVEEAGVTTVFFPLHRVERMELDESSGNLPSLEQRFSQKTGMHLENYLRRVDSGSETDGKTPSEPREG